MKELTLKNINSDKSILVNGVYLIYAYEGEKPKILSRLIGSDDSGLLYIGAAEKTTLKYRLNCFLMSSNQIVKQNNHSAGNKIKVNANLNGFIKQLTLNYKVIEAKDAKIKEKECLNQYKNKYGEVPPLNG